MLRDFRACGLVLAFSRYSVNRRGLPRRSTSTTITAGAAEMISIPGAATNRVGARRHRRGPCLSKQQAAGFFQRSSRCCCVQIASGQPEIKAQRSAPDYRGDVQTQSVDQLVCCRCRHNGQIDCFATPNQQKELNNQKSVHGATSSSKQGFRTFVCPSAFRLPDLSVLRAGRADGDATWDHQGSQQPGRKNAGANQSTAVCAVKGRLVGREFAV